MAQRSTIEWTDASWNPIRGCSRVSEGCRNCYAERQAARFRGKGQPYEGLVTIANGHPQWTGAVQIVRDVLREPIRWHKARRIFVNSMSDLFHENVTDRWIEEIFAVMALAPQHTFQILTKRPERMVKWFTTEQCSITKQEFVAHILRNTFSRQWLRRVASIPLDRPDFDWPLPNVWLGVSVEDQQTADERIPLLLETPAAVRWVSYEPALGPVDFTKWLHLEQTSMVVDWIVAGGESGPGARPPHPDWFRAVRKQCGFSATPFFFKQWGEWRAAREGFVVEYAAEESPNPQLRTIWPNGSTGKGLASCSGGCGVLMKRVGKKAAGSLLDGREYREFPEPARAAVT